MATSNPKLGYGSVLKVDESGGSTFNAIANEVTFSFTREISTSDTTTKSSSQWSESIPAIRSWSCTAECYRDHQSGGDTNGYEVMLTSYNNAAKLEIQASVDETGGPETWTGSAIMTSLAETFENGERAGWTATLQGTGAITIA